MATPATYNPMWAQHATQAAGSAHSSHHQAAGPASAAGTALPGFSLAIPMSFQPPMPPPMASAPPTAAAAAPPGFAMPFSQPFQPSMPSHAPVPQHPPPTLEPMMYSWGLEAPPAPPSMAAAYSQPHRSTPAPIAVPLDAPDPGDGSDDDLELQMLLQPELHPAPQQQQQQQQQQQLEHHLSQPLPVQQQPQPQQASPQQQPRPMMMMLPHMQQHAVRSMAPAMVLEPKHITQLSGVQQPGMPALSMQQQAPPSMQPPPPYALTQPLTPKQQAVPAAQAGNQQPPTSQPNPTMARILAQLHKGPQHAAINPTQASQPSEAASRTASMPLVIAAQSSSPKPSPAGTPTTPHVALTPAILAARIRAARHADDAPDAALPALHRQQSAPSTAATAVSADTKASCGSPAGKALLNSPAATAGMPGTPAGAGNTPRRPHSSSNDSDGEGGTAETAEAIAAAGAAGAAGAGAAGTAAAAAAESAAQDAARAAALADQSPKPMVFKSDAALLWVKDVAPELVKLSEGQLGPQLARIEGTAGTDIAACVYYFTGRYDVCGRTPLRERGKPYFAISDFIHELVLDLSKRPQLAEALAMLIAQRPDVARAFDHTLLRRVVALFAPHIALEAVMYFAKLPDDWQNQARHPSKYLMGIISKVASGTKYD